MNFTSWGLYPRIKNIVFKFTKKKELIKIICNHNKLIAYGNGRSYGDSAISNKIIHTIYNDSFIDFNEDTGLLHVEAGILLSKILESFVVKGWFLKVSPGTKFITVGGAIASDVHGKNHKVEGCFSECIEEFDIMLANRKVITCSRNTKPDLFKATCGGQGLTGIILNAKIYLKKINSQYIDQTSIKTKNLNETFNAFNKLKKKPYSVAWLDCSAKDDKIGKSILTFGDFKNDGKLNYNTKKQLNLYLKTIPFRYLFNSWTLKLFNWVYYNKKIKKFSKETVSLETFFYPLDSIKNWNHIYEKKGLIQYQFILPKKFSYEGLKEILKTISNSCNIPFLAVLKIHGKSNENYLSFPIEGFSLSLDFKIKKGLFDFLDHIDEIVVKYEGRIYLAKDSRVSKEIFQKGYPQINAFRKFRKKNNMKMKFQSFQSNRLDI